MDRSKRAAAAGVFAVFLILVSCGEFDSVFPVNQTYLVSARAGDYSLDEYSVIRQDDEIRPFFVHSIKEDQDITGLTVFLRTPEGKQAGKKIRYAIAGPEEEEDGEMPIPAAGTDRELPYFRLDEGPEIGFYRMVFQVFGEKGKIFSEIEKPVFYLADADYSISEISAYLPGYSQDSYLIAPGTVIMLEAKSAGDERLDPYVVWYDGKKPIGGGRIPSGGNKLFFKIPEGNGFRLLRAEAFPFPPAGKTGAGTPGAEETARGKIRELSLPVSVKGRGPEFFAFPQEDRQDLSGHYLFAGNLEDSLDPSPGRVLTKENNGGESGWLGYGGIYGLAVGPGDCYLIPREIFGLPDPEKKIFSFRCKMLRDGTVFSAFPADGSANLELSREKETLVLTLKTGTSSGKVEAPLPSTEDFITFSLGFGENAWLAVLSPEGTAEISLDLAGFSAGIYRLGAPVSENPEENGEAPEEEEKEPPGLPVLILDELAITVRREE
jgi:hypothetical protein